MCCIVSAFLIIAHFPCFVNPLFWKKNQKNGRHGALRFSSTENKNHPKTDLFCRKRKASRSETTKSRFPISTTRSSMTWLRRKKWSVLSFRITEVPVLCRISLSRLMHLKKRPGWISFLSFPGRSRIVWKAQLHWMRGRGSLSADPFWERYRQRTILLFPKWVDCRYPCIHQR